MDEMRERLMQLLSRYFDIGDSYTYNLKRVKSAFAVDTVYLEDFDEYTENDVANLADYLIEEGTILPPVKVGQTVYQTDGTRIYELTVNGGSVLVYDTDSIAFSDEAIGKSIFLTREAAEAALKARDNNAD